MSKSAAYPVVPAVSIGHLSCHSSIPVLAASGTSHCPELATHPGLSFIFCLVAEVVNWYSFGVGGAE